MNLDARFAPYKVPAAAAQPDRWIALTVVDETLSAAERRFGAAADGQLLDRYALEAAIDLLSSPTRIIDFIPDLALRRVSDRVAAKEFGQ
jgi:hypothetical protein